MTPLEFLQAKFPTWNLREGALHPITIRELNLVEALEEYAKIYHQEQLNKLINEDSKEYSEFMAAFAKICEKYPRSKSANSIRKALDL